MGALSGAECCVDEYNDNRKAEERKQALVEQEEYNKQATPTPNGANHDVKDILDMTKVASTSPSPTIVALNLPPKEIAPWDINSRYHSDLSYMEMSARYERYRKPPNFYDDCIRKLRSTKRRYKSTQKQAQYDMIIQNTAKALLRTRTMLTASMEETQQTSATNLIHEISEDDEKFWFQPFLYNVIDSITNSFIKLIDSKQDLVLNYVEFYQILQSLPVLTDVLAKDYPFHFHSEMQDRLKYLFDPNDVQCIKTKQDIINIISKANKLNRKVSAVGYATSFPSKHPNDAEEKSNNSPLIAAMIPDHLRAHTYDIKLEYTEDLSKVTIPDYPLMFVEDIGDNKIRIGGATPVWLYREWCHKRIEAKKPIPSEPGTAMSINHSFVGLITVAEHGGGIFASSLSDYVTKMKVINSEGKENEYSIDNDPTEFQAIIPNLGLLGIVTEIELQFKEEYYCNLSVRVINIDKLFPKSKSKKSKGRTFSKVFEDIINATVYNEFFWFPTTNQIYSLSLSRCEDPAASSQFFPSKTWEKNWVVLQKEINTLSEMLSIQLLNGRTWTSKLCTKLITKISSNLLNDLVIKLNLRSKVRKKVSSPGGTNMMPQSMKIPSCDALHLFNFYPSQNNNNLFQNIEWLFPLDSASAKKILINDHHVPNVDLAAHLFMSAINCYNQNMLKKKCYPYQLPLNLKVIKGSEYGLSHCHGADFYCAVSMSVHDIEHNKIFQQFQREFIQTCKSKVYRSNIDGIKPHWKNASLYKYLEHPVKNGVNGKQQNGHSDSGDIEGIYAFIKHQYEGKLDKLVEIAQRDNKDPQIFQPGYLHKIFQ